tara:strand:+ start:381 stop:1292 length:912 start_codon:yes stop_codon:yes gene_type:complete
MKINYKKLESDLKKIGSDYIINEPMSKHTTFGIGGPVDFLILPLDNSQIPDIIKSINLNKINFIFLGSGSNILVSDKGIKGAVISLKKSSKNIIFEDSTVLVDSGVMLSALVQEIHKKNITGFETLMGVPGTLGGALVMNAGAFGSEISNNLIFVETINILGQKKRYNVDEIDFEYRKSNFPKNEIIINALFNCKKGLKSNINDKRDIASKQRKTTQPLTYRSAGSIFKNPKENAAGYLIDKAGLKGLQIGGAKISEKHANFIVNLGNAKSTDVLELIDIIKKKIYQMYKIKLELEIKILGES